MADSLVNVLVPYSRFREYHDRRRTMSVELTRPDQPPTINADVVPAAAEVASAQKVMANHVEH
jgi:hypothetical protein